MVQVLQTDQCQMACPPHPLRQQQLQTGLECHLRSQAAFLHSIAFKGEAASTVVEIMSAPTSPGGEV